MSNVITIALSYNYLRTKVKRHLTIVGKRARTNDGKSMYEDFHTTSAEDPVFNDLFSTGAETLANNLVDLAIKFVINNDSDNEPSGITFSVNSERWFKVPEGESDTSITNALRDALENYIYNYAIAQYLSLIHPGTGDKYPPRWGTPYNEQCQIILNNIRTLAFSKVSRPKPFIPYTSKIEIFGSEIQLEIGEKASLLYSIDYDCIDDIDVLCNGDSARIIRECGKFNVYGKHPGVTHAILYSVHDESVYADIDLVVLNEDGSVPSTVHSPWRHPFRHHHH